MAPPGRAVVAHRLRAGSDGPGHTVPRRAQTRRPRLGLGSLRRHLVSQRRRWLACLEWHRGRQDGSLSCRSRRGRVGVGRGDSDGSAREVVTVTLKFTELKLPRCFGTLRLLHSVNAIPSDLN